MAGMPWCTPHQISLVFCLWLGLWLQGVNCYWAPTNDIELSYQIGAVNVQTDSTAQLYTIDLFDSSNYTIASIQRQGYHVACYISAGTYEDWRPDAADFPAAVLGASLADWPGERYLDIRSSMVRGLMTKRIALCQQSGYDSIDFDNMDAWEHGGGGFNLTAADQLDYNIFLAEQAHSYGLSCGLKNDVVQIPALVQYFDYAVNEQCAKMGNCAGYALFVAAAKPVYDIEYCPSSYSLFLSTVCTATSSLGIHVSLYRMSLDGSALVLCPYNGTGHPQLNVTGGRYISSNATDVMSASPSSPSPSPSPSSAAGSSPGAVKSNAATITPHLALWAVAMAFITTAVLTPMGGWCTP